MYMRRITAIIIGAFAALLVSCTPEEKQHELPFVPSNAPIIVRISNLSALANAGDSSGIYWNSVLPIDSLIAFGANTWMGAYMPSGAQRYTWIWSTTESLDSLNWQSGTDYPTYGSYAMTKTGGWWAISQQKSLLRDCTNQVENGFSIMQQLGFVEVFHNASGTDPINLFIQHSELGYFGESVLKTDLGWAQHFAQWTAVDIALRNNKCIATGLLLCPDSSNTYSAQFNHKAGQFTFTEHIPASAQYALGQKSTDIVSWTRGFQTYRDVKNRQRNAVALLEPLGLDPIETALLMDGEFIRFGYGQAVVAGIKLQEDANTSSFTDAISESTQLIAGRTHGTLKADAKHAFSALFGWFFSGIEPQFYAIKDGWLYLSSESSTITAVIAELSGGKNWTGLSTMSKMDKEKGQFIFAINPSNFDMAALAGSHWTSVLNQDAKVGASLRIKDNYGFGDLVITTEVEETPQSNYLWSATLESPIARGPFFIYNHSNGANEVVVQDDQNTLYWIAENGEIRWKASLEGPIIGNVSQVDLFMNKKLQLAFTTANQLHVYDRLGRTVEEFPVRLPKPTTVGLSVMDYEKSRNYRLLVPCGNSIYNFNGQGKEVQGWTKNCGIESPISQGVLHYARNGKDYLITGTQDGHALVLNRKGDIRIRLNSTATGAAWELNKGTQVPSLYKATAGGRLATLDFNGVLDSLDAEVQPLKDVVVMPFGVVLVGNNQLVNQGEVQTITTPAAGRIVGTKIYPGGTALMFIENGQVHIANIQDGQSDYGVFQGSAGVAGRFHPQDLPVAIIADGTTLIAYQLK